MESYTLLSSTEKGHDDFSKSNPLEAEQCTVEYHPGFQNSEPSLLRRLCKFAVTFALGIAIGVACVSRYDQTKGFMVSDGVHHFVPQMPMKHINFTGFGPLTHPPSEESNRAWNALVPDGGGFVIVPNPTHLNLRPGIETDTGEQKYLLAMYHQLHCLGILRRNFWRATALQRQNSTSDQEQEEKLRASLEKEYLHNHPQHCFEYLTQSIVCNADLTLESARLEKDGRRFQVDGVGTQHTCKDPEAVRGWIEGVKGPETRYLDFTGEHEGFM